MLKKTGSMLLLSLLITAGVVGCSGGSGNSGPELTSIEVTPANTSLAVNTSQQFTATGIYSDNSTKDLTALVAWSSSDPAVAVSTTGMVTVVSDALSSSTAAAPTSASAGGAIMIKASWRKLWGEGNVSVKRSSLVSIAVTPTNPADARGTNRQFTATGTFSDNTTQDITAAVVWSSSNTGVATISNASGSAGLATSLAAGSTTIKATSGIISASTTLTVNAANLVSIAVTPTNPGVAKGTNQQFTATGIYSDNTTRDLTSAVTWTSSDAGVATISNTAGSNGLATAVSAGSATIKASGGAISGSTVLTVNAAALVSISITPPNPGIANGMNQQLTATGTYADNTTQNLTASVVWSSSNAGVATISNAAGSNGLATAVAAGSTTIKAVSGSISASTTLTVNPAALVSIAISPVNPGIAKGTTQLFTATGTYSDSTTQDLTKTVAWSSATAAVATISNAAGSNGLATSVAAGSTLITAASGGISASTTLTVNPAALVSIAISPVNPGIAKGTTQQFTATGTYSDSTMQDLTKTATWSSSNTAAATISNAAGSNGLATSVAPGSTLIKAVSGSISASTTLTVNAATLVSIAVTPANTTMGTGSNLHFTAIGTYSDNSTQDLTNAATWSSSNTAVATISNAAGSQGLATAAAAGSTTIAAVSGSVSASTGLSVVNRSVVLAWNAPTTNTDGTALTDLTGYRIYYGTSSGNYTTTINIGTTTTYTLTNMAPGTHYFTVTAVNTAGAESAFSNEANKTVL